MLETGPKHVQTITSLVSPLGSAASVDKLNLVEPVEPHHGTQNIRWLILKMVFVFVNWGREEGLTVGLCTFRCAGIFPLSQSKQVPHC